MPAGVVADRVKFRQADFIARSIDNLRQVLGEASIVVAIVLVVTILFAWAGFVCWAVGVLHAILVINSAKAERRHREMMDAVKTGAGPAS